MWAESEVFCFVPVVRRVQQWCMQQWGKRPQVFKEDRGINGRRVVVGGHFEVLRGRAWS